MATATAFKTIGVTLEDGVNTITLQRTDVLNAFDNVLTTELAKALKDASRNKDVRVVVITGSGRAFSSGQDLADLKTRSLSAAGVGLSDKGSKHPLRWFHP